MNAVLIDGLIAAAMFLLMIGCAELGRWAELARARREPGSPVGATGIVEPSILGLLALLLGFTFGWSGSRLDYHRRLVAEEANAIGTAYLRIDLLPPEVQPQLRDLFRKYLEERIRAGTMGPEGRVVRPEPEESARLQREIWSRAEAAVKRTEWTPPAILLLPAINAMIDVTTKRRIELYSHVPLMVIALFGFVALVNAFLVGRTTAASKTHNVLQSVTFSAAIAATLFVVLDLEFPRAGLIRLNLVEEAMIQLRDTMR